MTTSTERRRGSGISEIVLADCRNGALSLEDLRSLTTKLADADADPDTAVIVVSGPAGTFCAGGDLADFLACADLDVLSEAVEQFFLALLSAQKPLIAAVDGKAIGLGMTMLLHFDAVYATPQSTFVAPFSDLGLTPEAGSTLLAPARFGYLRAFELLCLGLPISASEARHAGLISRVTESGAATFRAMEAADRLARKPRVALQTTRKLLRGDRADVADRIAVEIAEFRRRLEDSSTIRRLSRITRARARAA